MVDAGRGMADGDGVLMDGRGGEEEGLAVMAAHRLHDVLSIFSPFIFLFILSLLLSLSMTM